MIQANQAINQEISGYNKYSVLIIYIIYSIAKITTILQMQGSYSSRCVLDLSAYLVLYTTTEIFDTFLFCMLLVLKFFRLEQPPKIFVLSIQLGMETFRIVILLVASVVLIEEIDCLQTPVEILGIVLVLSEILKILFLIKPCRNFWKEIMSVTSYEYFDEIAKHPHVNLEPYLKSNVNDKFCAICLDDTKTEEKRVVLACNHSFHFVCINTWTTYKSSCPVCRASII
ncbi:unnamed protein product [Blepharisma stoltei]|uniref:RING-type E3 ubiquitin transferase n=1 Tax=Blepharisma stoltei TaxID=1481888 RepID=A0AAU9K1Z7_9CILI|nr:unnamed protein product [Blepharisma stoltei]